jgi:hypothetical protein
MVRRLLVVTWVLMLALASGNAPAQLTTRLRQDLQGFDQLALAQQRQTLRSLLAAGNAAMQDPDAQQVLQRLLLRSIDTFLAHRDGLCDAGTLFRLGDPALFPAAFGNTNGSDENLVLLIPASTTNWRGVTTANNPGHIDNGPYRVPIDTIDTLLNNTLTDTWWHEANHTLLSTAGVGVQDPVCNMLRLNDRDAATSNIGMGCVADDDPPGTIGYHHPLIRGLGQQGLAAYDQLDRFQGALRKADAEEDVLLKRAEPLDPERVRQIWSSAHREFSAFQDKWRYSLYSELTLGPVTYGRLQPGFVRVYRNTVGTFFSEPQAVALAYQASCIRVPEPTGELRGIRPPKWVFEETLPLMPVRIDLDPQSEQRRGKAYRQTFIAQVRAKGSWLQPQVRGLAGNFRYGLLQRGLLTVDLSKTDGKATLLLERKGETEPDSAYAPVAGAIPGTFQVPLDRRNTFRVTFEHPDTTTLSKDTSFTLRLFFEDTAGVGGAPQKVYDSAETLAFIDLTGAKKPVSPPPPSSAPPGQVPMPPAAPVRVKSAERVLKVRFDFFGDPGTWVATTPLVNIPNPAFLKTDLTWLIGVNGIDGSIGQQAPEWSNLQAVLQRIADPMAQVRAQMAATYQQMGLDPATASQAIGAVTPFIGQFTQTYKLLDTGYQRVGRPVEIWAYLEPATLPGVPFPYQTQDATGRPVTRSLEARLEILDWEFSPAVPPGKSLGLKDGIAGWTPPAPAGDPAAAAVPEDLYLDARIRFRMTLYDPATGKPYLEGGQPLTWDSLYRNVRLGLVFYPIGSDPGGVVVEHKDAPVPPGYEDEEEQEEETVKDGEDEDDVPVVARRGWKTVVLEPLSYRVPPRTREEQGTEQVVSCFQDVRPCGAAFGAIVSADPAKFLPPGLRMASADGEPASVGDNIPARRYRHVHEGMEWTLVRLTPVLQPLPDGEPLTLVLFWRVEQGLGDAYKNLLERVWETVQLGDIADPAESPKGRRFRWLSRDPGVTDRPTEEELKQLEVRLWQSLIYARRGKATARDFTQGLDAADVILKARPSDEAIRKGRSELEALQTRTAGTKVP